jgi:hypothetical protein
MVGIISKTESRIEDSSVLAGLESSGLPLKIKHFLRQWQILDINGSFVGPSMGSKKLSRGTLDASLWTISDLLLVQHVV